TDSRELAGMAAASLSVFPVLTQSEYVNSYAVLEKTSQGATILSVTFRKDELIPLLEKIENWGADFPVVMPDAWAVWKSATLDFQMPEDYVWVWIDPAHDEKKIFLKVFVVSRGLPRFIFQPFVAKDREENIANAVSTAIGL